MDLASSELQFLYQLFIAQHHLLVLQETVVLRKEHLHLLIALKMVAIATPDKPPNPHSPPC